MKKIIITGGTSRFASVLKKIKTKHKLYYPTKKEFDILNERKIEKYLNKKKVDIVIHLAGLSRPMKIHEEDITKSINLNIIGTANVTKCCYKNNIKLIYFSTNYVYPGVKGNYREKDPLLPVNYYAWSKLGGETSVHLYKNSLILRICMTEKPFVHKKAFANVQTSFAYHHDIAKKLLKLINHKGVINLGGKKMSVYKFAKKENKNVKKIFLKKGMKLGIPFDSSLSLQKLNKIIKK
jgi:dTDP-4-dehydrorhamnose reductase|tara:strand:+ start:678 stop:1388 length:711 start_codon:yes stop_codon:yes gene_type:complete